MAEKDHLLRQIGVVGLSANLINIVVGAGIFALPAIVAAGLGSASIFAYLFCGFLVALVMLCFAEVGTQITVSGGAYAYIEKTFGRYPGFLTAILFCLSAISADAAVANAIADIIGSFFPLFQVKLVRILFFAVVFGGLAYINVIGLKQGVNLVKALTVIKLVPLLLLVLFAWPEMTPAYLAIDGFPGINDLGQTALILFFAFQGAESGLSVSGEVKNPQKTIPMAILIGISTVLVFYVLIQTVSQGVLGPSLATFTENPLSEVASAVFGPVGFTLITIGAAVSMFGNLSGEVLSIPRVLYQAAVDRVVPAAPLARIHYRFSTPYIAVISYASLGFIFASAGGFRQLAVISSASILLVYLGVTLAVIRLRRSNNATQGGFVIPGGLIVPVLATLITIWMLSSLTMDEMTGFLLFVIALTIIYFLIKKVTSGKGNLPGG